MLQNVHAFAACVLDVGTDPGQKPDIKLFTSRHGAAHTYINKSVISWKSECRHVSAVYILDDGKDPDKKAWVESFKDPDMLYSPGHIKTGPEVNGKACNLNSTLRALFPAGSEIGLEEVKTGQTVLCSCWFRHSYMVASQEHPSKL